MKKIVIIGKNSYIGIKFKRWLNEFYPNKYQINTISSRNGEWKNKDFSKYDILFHVAGIAHVPSNFDNKEKYMEINYKLALAVAKKAKSENINQYIFMSSIIVYGESGRIDQKKIIDKNTMPKPSNYYGKSKLKAENEIVELEDDNFHTVIIRSPMVYGKDSKGNYSKLSNIAKITPIFPNIKNQRSMIYIDNLCYFIKLMIDNNENGIFFPQNKRYVNTSKMVKLISEVNGKNIKLIKIFNPVLRLLSRKIKIINKVFGNLVYDKSLSKYKIDYRIINFKESIKNTEI